MPVQSDYTSDLAWTSSNGRTTLSIGDTVYVNGEGDYRGKICYLGEVHFAKGEFAGVTLDHPLGNHDGSYRGRRYFQCEGDHGVFARVGKVSKVALIPASNESVRCGLWRKGTGRVSFARESSPVSVYSSSSGVSGRSFSKSPSPTPSGGSSVGSGSAGLFGSSGSGLFGTSRSSSSSSSSPVGYLSGLKIGDRVIVASSVGETKTGVLRYLGRVEFASGEYAGIELFHPLGKNDGTVRGRHYFSCRHPYGLFVPSYKVQSSPANRLGGSSQLGTKDNVHRIYQYATPRGIRAGSYDEDFY